jgi:prophage antirepressor-like protein
MRNPDKGSLADLFKDDFEPYRLANGEEGYIMSEPGVYLFLMAEVRKTPKALPLVDWLAHEVLPSIRRTGRYELGDKQFPCPELEGMLKTRAEVEASIKQLDRESRHLQIVKPGVPLVNRERRRAMMRKHGVDARVATAAMHAANELAVRRIAAV